jgi:hypothetical protein
MGVTDRSVRTYLQELEAAAFISIKQRGLGKPNLYELDLLPSATDRKIFPVRTGRKRQIWTGNIFLPIRHRVIRRRSNNTQYVSLRPYTNRP